MADTKKEKWLGGPIRWGKRGPTYVIERWIDGTHWHVSTKCRTERAALKELEKFEASPRDYRKARSAKSSGVEMTAELVDKYLEHMEARGLDRGYIDSHEKYLGDALVQLAGRDLSRMTSVEVRQAVDATVDAKHRAAIAARRKAIKAFGTWMRRSEGLLTRANDPTMDIPVETLAAEKTRRKKAMPIDLVRQVVPLMAADVADVVVVLAGTGLHISELIRLHEGKGGLHEPAEWQRKEQGVVLNISVQHKDKGKTHVVAVCDQQAADAARRMMARESFPNRNRIYHQGRIATKALGVKFTAGWLRHSLSTWLAMGRVSEEDIAKQLGHTSTRQVRRAYIDLGLAAHPLPIPHLKLVTG